MHGATIVPAAKYSQTTVQVLLSDVESSIIPSAEYRTPSSSIGYLALGKEKYMTKEQRGAVLFPWHIDLPPALVHVIKAFYSDLVGIGRVPDPFKDHVPKIHDPHWNTILVAF